MVSNICEQILLNGVCQLDGCTDKHDVHVCSLCRVLCTSMHNLNQHLAGSKHKKRLEGTSTGKTVLCTVCSTKLSSAKEYVVHARGRRHKSALQSYDKDPGPEEVEGESTDTTYCETCATQITSKNWNSHLGSRRHRSAKTFSELKGALDEAEKNKNGVVVEDESGIDFGILEYSLSQSYHYKMVKIENTGSTGITLTSAAMTSSHQTSRRIVIQFSVDDYSGELYIPGKGETSVKLYFRPGDDRGRFEDRLELFFLDITLNERFAITRPVRAIIGNVADYDLLRVKAPYVRPKAKREQSITTFIPGVPAPALAEIKWSVKLDKYDIPSGLKETAFGKGTSDELSARVRNGWLPKTFESQTYGRYFGVLLWIEEEKSRRDLQHYDMEDVTLEPKHPYFRLKVDGLAEKRPSIIVTDRILVKNYSGTDNNWFEGYVHKVHEKEVDLRFNNSFHSYRGQKYFVRFDLNRLTLRRMHQALNTAFKSPRVLFPAREHVGLLKPPTSPQIGSIRFVDKKIGENPPQKLAVATILYRIPGSVPFVVFGPPGTGKTVTIIEAIRQLLLKDSNTHILACAPSNSAADIICERLSTNGLSKAQLFRLNAPSRDVKHVSQIVMKHSLKSAEGTFILPLKGTLQTYSVIVSTCFSASTPYGIGIAKGHFSHIFIDEVGQATEPEVMIPIKTMADNKTNVILSGDNKQLGPIVRSPVARELGLAKSYLDRLMSNPLYDEVTGKGLTVVKLLKNWRSHVSILKFPNDEFYKSELEACGDPVVTHSALRWDRLPKADFPIIFHGISGKDEREASSPSFFNIGEASEVKSYVQNLFDDRRLRLTAQQIGVISPYYAQVTKIRQLLSNSGRGGLSAEAKNIKVGSVEEFQGQERRVIIISTVRSSTDFIHFDLRHTLGFVANPRRFNVAITRAQALLIIIGDPAVLSLDPLWKSFINYVHVNGGYTGKRIDWDPLEDIDRSIAFDNVRRVRALTEREELVARIHGQTEDLADRDDDDELEGNVERPWRDDD